jgi:membrane associated rhomboid family serine protease
VDPEIMMSTYGRSPSAGAYYRPSFFGGFRFFPPVIKWLLILNVGIWLAFDVLLAPFTIGGVPIFQILASYLALWPLGTHFFPWQLLTYMFMHGGFWHIFLNMFSLWIFGTELEHLWGSKRFLIYYLLCGLGGAVTNLLVAPLIGQGAPTVGASGAVFGVLLAFGVLFPDRPIYLYFLLPVRAKFFILGLIALELYTGITGTVDGIAHFAHLGGAAAGAVYLAAVLKVNLLGGFRKKPEVYGGTAGRGWGAPPRPGEEVQEAKFYDIRTGKPPQEEGRPTQETIDAILDKIGRGGYQSLTDDEKRILQEASKNIH